MPVFRVKKVKDYTIMPNLHLRNRQLSLRAKGLLCQMLSMPPEWNFTLQGFIYQQRGFRRHYDGYTRIRAGGIYYPCHSTERKGTTYRYIKY